MSNILRDRKIDTIKGILIILVILGHLLELKINNPINNYIHNGIYLFHMPLFCFISGYVCNTKRNFFLLKTIEFMEVYLVYQLVFTSLYNDIQIDTPFFHLWYLPALFVWRIIDYYTKNISSLHILFISLIIAILSGFIEVIGYKFTLSRLLVFSFFYYSGRIFRESNVKDKIYQLPHKYAITLLSIVFIALLFIPNIGRVVYCSQPYTVLSPNIIIGCSIRLLYFVVAITLSFSIISLVKENKIMCNIGKNTLPIYIYHVLLIYLFRLFDIPSNIIVFIISTLLFIWVITLLGNYLNFNLILHPITYFIEKKIKNRS